MRPTILEGDVVLVNRVAYDIKLPLTDIALARLGEPKRDEVLAFTSPADGVRLIKRLVALPGDVVEIQNEVVFVNGVAAEYKSPTQVEERLESGGTTTGLKTTEKSGAGNTRSSSSRTGRPSVPRSGRTGEKIQ